MNLMDLIPVDLVAEGLKLAGIEYQKIVPSTDPNITMGMAIGAAALIRDLKQRGLLDDTLVIWGGEFGRGVAGQGQRDSPEAGRDHHPRCFTMWMAGGGIKPGTTYGATDDFSYNVAENPVHVHDLHATMLHLMGIDHEKLIYKFQGRYFRLTDVHGTLVKPILA